MGRRSVNNRRNNQYIDRWQGLSLQLERYGSLLMNVLPVRAASPRRYEAETPHAAAEKTAFSSSQSFTQASGKWWDICCLSRIGGEAALGGCKKKQSCALKASPDVCIFKKKQPEFAKSLPSANCFSPEFGLDSQVMLLPHFPGKKKQRCSRFVSF